MKKKGIGGRGFPGEEEYSGRGYLRTEFLLALERNSK